MTETVSATEEQEVVSQVLNEVEQQVEPVQEEREERVPLSALQKERKKRQDVEQELKVYREHQLSQLRANKAAEPEEDLFEPATKKDLGKSQEDIIRAVEERSWIRNNPEKAEEINEKLAEFLKQRPNLASAISSAGNRYEEAWELMDKLSPKQKAALRSAPMPKKETPGSPMAIPKAAAMNQSVDVMTMSDSEYVTWRQSVKKRR